MKQSSIVALALVLAAACGSSKDKAAGGGGDAEVSCHSPQFDECTEYNKANRALGDDHLKKLCTSFQGTFATTPCPTDKMLGKCRRDEGTKVFYEGYAITGEELARMCTSSEGTWQAAK
jgi:hypothetical protein